MTLRARPTIAGLGFLDSLAGNRVALSHPSDQLPLLHHHKALYLGRWKPFHITPSPIPVDFIPCSRFRTSTSRAIRATPRPRIFSPSSAHRDASRTQPQRNHTSKPRPTRRCRASAVGSAASAVATIITIRAPALGLDRPSSSRILHQVGGSSLPFLPEAYLLSRTRRRLGTSHHDRSLIPPTGFGTSTSTGGGAFWKHAKWLRLQLWRYVFLDARPVAFPVSAKRIDALSAQLGGPFDFLTRGAFAHLDFPMYTNQHPGGFGGSAFGQNKTGFGSTATTTASSLFGGTTATAGGGFGGGGSSGFGGTTTPFGGGAASGGLFSQQSKPAFGSSTTGGLFGGSGTSGGTSTGFGGTSGAGGGFGGSTTTPSFSSTQQNNGTGTVPFNPHTDKDPGATSGSNAYQSVSAMPNYNQFNFEELRLEDYKQGRKFGTANSGTGGFGATNFGGFSTSTTAGGASGFGGTSSGTGGLFGGSGTASNFGATATACLCRIRWQHVWWAVRREAIGRFVRRHCCHISPTERRTLWRKRHHRYHRLCLWRRSNVRWTLRRPATTTAAAQDELRIWRWLHRRRLRGHCNDLSGRWALRRHCCNIDRFWHYPTHQWIWWKQLRSTSPAASTNGQQSLWCRIRRLASDKARWTFWNHPRSKWARRSLWKPDSTNRSQRWLVRRHWWATIWGPLRRQQACHGWSVRWHVDWHSRRRAFRRLCATAATGRWPLWRCSGTATQWRTLRPKACRTWCKPIWREHGGAATAHRVYVWWLSAANAAADDGKQPLLIDYAGATASTTATNPHSERVLDGSHLWQPATLRWTRVAVAKLWAYRYSSEQLENRQGSRPSSRPTESIPMPRRGS